MSVSTSSGVERHASWLELFDLVFVVVVAALAGQLHEDHSVLGLAVFAGLFVPVWWCWRSFTWYATGYSDDPRCRIGLLAGMLGVAVLSIGVAGAAGEGESRTFVLAYVGLLIILGGLYGRIWLLFPAARSLARRYVLGYAVSVVIWSASLALQEGARPWLWAVAMVVLIATPVAVLRQPRRAYHAAHIAERYGLFTIIVLGESVVVTVSGLDAGASTDVVAVALLGFGIAVTIWWTYFGRYPGRPGRHRRGPLRFGRRSMSWSSPGSRPRPSVSSSPSRPRARAAASSWSTGLRSAPALPPTCLRWSHPRDDPPPGPDRGPETSRTRLSASSNSATVVYRSFGSTAQALRSTFARVSETPGAASRMSGTPVATAALVPSEADRWIELDRQPAHMNAASVPGAVLLRAHHLHDRGAVRRRLAYEGARGRTACGESMSTTDVVHGSTRGWSPECS